MNIVKDAAAIAAEVNQEIRAIKEEIAPLLERERALVKRVGSLSASVLLRLDDFETHEKAWVTKNPLAAFLIALIVVVGAFGLGVVCG